MIDNILVVVLTILTLFFEPIFLSIFSFSLFFVSWVLFFKQRNSILSKIDFVILSLTLDVAFKYYLGTHILAVLIYEIVLILFSKIIGEGNTIFFTIIKIVTISMYYAVLLFILSFNISSLINIVISSIITYLVIEIIRGKFSFKRNIIKI